MFVLLFAASSAITACGDDAPANAGDGDGGNVADGGASRDGGGAGDDSGGSGDDGGMMPPPPVAITSCVASGKGKDYQVGSGAGQIASLDLVPWESLAPGDTVRIFYRAAPYVGKFMISAKGTDAAPVRVCGVKGPNGERPIIDGNGATTRAALLPVYGNKVSDQDIHQARSVLLIKHNGSGSFTDFPSHIQVDGLAIRRAHPSYTFKDAAGATHNYDSFGACVWVERGHDITIADNDITDCTQAIFSRSTDDGDFAVTKNLRIVGNSMSNNGIAGDDHTHTSYIQSVGVVVEFNHYGALRPGANGNSMKDRSVGSVIRFNRIDDGAHAIDLVEAEDYPMTATANPAYRAAFVYGNQINKSGNLGSFIHYGGDHYGSMAGASWGEPIFRKGTLYFFSNTVYATGSGAAIFQVSTTEEHVEVFNNVFVFAPSVGTKNLRTTSDVGAPWVSGGIVNLGRNWASSGWADSDSGHPVPGQLGGASNMLSGATPPIDLVTFLPVAGSAIVDAAMAGPAAASGYKVDFQLDAKLKATPRTVKGAASDLGAVEL